MGQHNSFTRRGRLFLGCASAVGLAAALLAPVSCGSLQSDVDDAGGGGTTGTPTPGKDGGSGTVVVGSSGDSGGGNTTIISGDGGGGGLVDAGKAACTASSEQLPHTPGIGSDGKTPIDISQVTGYTPDTTIATTAASMLPAGNNTARANQMRGTPPQSGGMNQFNDIYRTLDDTNTMIKGILFRDGPRGVDLDAPVYTGPFGSAAHNLGKGYATAFPVTVAHGASWDLDLESKIGSDLGDEVLASGNDMTLSPCVNILRHPAWGRSQETYGEDSFALGREGTAFVEGAQQFIPACVKHFAANNIEDGRFNQIAVMDSQTLHEIYGRHFEMIVQEGGVACVMASYNSVQISDGDNVAHKDTSNPPLLTDMLRTTFGFKGFVMSDFWAMPADQSTTLMTSQYSANASAAVAAGLDMEMPWNLNFANVETAATAAQLDTSAKRILQQKLRFKTAATQGTVGLKAPTTGVGTNGITGNTAHLADAELLAEEAMVLLKNSNNTLPIASSVKNIAVIGAQSAWTLSGTNQTGTVNWATDARIGDLGSSRVNADPATSVGPAAGITAAAPSGVTVTTGTTAAAAANADFVVVVAGLTPQDEGEEYTGAGDRTNSSGAPNFNLDPKVNTGVQNALITAVAALNKPMVVVIEAGSAVNMPWLASVPAVVMAWYPGEQGGTALGRLLFGNVNFSGKLPITWPKSEADEPPFNQGGTTGGSTTMGYYLGYRYFDQMMITPLFAYGSGSSYTKFSYDALSVPCSTVTQDSVVDVKVQVTNTGTVAGSEVSYLFVSYPNTKVRRSVKELKGFNRTPSIPPGSSAIITIPLRIQDLKYWDTTNNKWAWETGPVQIMVGGASDNLPLKDTVTVQ